MDPLADLKQEPADYEEYDTSQSMFLEDLGGDQPEADPGGDIGGGQGAQAGGSEVIWSSFCQNQAHLQPVVQGVLEDYQGAVRARRYPRNSGDGLRAGRLPCLPRYL